MRAIRIYNHLTESATRQNARSTMIVCVCRRVSDREIVRFVRAGMTFDDVQFELGVATQCGRCEGCARDIVAQCSATAPVAAIHCDGPNQESRTWSQSQSH